MAIFRYDMPDTPQAGSIADIIMRGGQIQAQSAQQMADIQARAQAQAGANWGRAVETLGQLPLQMQEQQRRDQLANMDTAYKTQQMQIASQQMAEKQRQVRESQAANAALVQSIKKNTNPDTGEINTQAVAAEVGSQFPQQAADWAENQAKFATSMQTLANMKQAAKDSQQKAANAEDLFIAQTAADAPDANAFATAIGTAHAAGHLSDKTAARVIAEISNTPFDALKAQYIKTGDRLAPTIDLKPDEVRYGAISRTPLYTGPKKVDKPNTPAEYDVLAFAKSKHPEIKDREVTLGDMTVGDWGQWHTMEALRKQQEAVNTNLATHIATKGYDEAHPKPPLELNDHQKQIGKDLASGILSFANFNSMLSSRVTAGGATPAEVKAAIYDYARELNPTFAPTVYEMGLKQAMSPQNQTRLVAIRSLSPVIDKIVNLASSLGQNSSDIPAFNKLLQEGNFQLGGRRVASLRQLQTLVGEEAGNALGVGTGSDLKTKLGLDVVNTSLGLPDFIDTMRQLQDVMATRQKEIIGSMGVYGQGETAAPIARPPGGDTPGASGASGASAAPAPRIKVFNPATGKAE